MAEFVLCSSVSVNVRVARQT